MSNADITPQEALLRLGASTGEAVAQVFDMYAPGLVERGDVTVLPDPALAFDNLPFGAVAASVSYVNGVTGANVFVMSPAGARALAGAMGVPPPDETDVPPAEGAPLVLTELELSAVSEAANQMMAAAASAISVVLGQEVEISPPVTRVVDDTDSALDMFGSAPHATSTTFLIGSEACRLVQLVPSAFVVRMARAIDELADQPSEGDGDHGSPAAGGASAAEGGVTVHEALEGITLRVWAELGRAQLPLGSAVDLPLGAVVDLDCAADAPVDIFVNGLRFAQGQLLVTDDGEWAVRLEALRGQDPPAAPETDAHPQPQGALT